MACKWRNYPLNLMEMKDDFNVIGGMESRWSSFENPKLLIKITDKRYCRI